MGFPKGFPFGRRCQNLLSYWLCGLAEKFKSHLPHEIKGSTRKSWSFYFVRKGTLTQQLRCVGFPKGTRRCIHTRPERPRQVFFRILSGISCSRDSARHRSISSWGRTSTIDHLTSFISSLHLFVNSSMFSKPSE